MTRNTPWHLTNSQFTYLWDQLYQDAPPYPLQAVPHTVMDDDYRREQLNLHHWARTVNDPDLLGVLRTLHDPAISIIIKGIASQSDTRIFGASNGNYSALAYQHPHTSPTHSNNISLWAGNLPGLIATVTQSLPPAQPGHQQPITDNNHHNIDHHMNTFLQQPLSQSIVITVTTQYRAPTNPLGSFTLLDIDQDGRYLLREKPTKSIHPITEHNITTILHTLTQQADNELHYEQT